MFKMVFSTSTPAFEEEGGRNEKFEISRILGEAQSDLSYGKSSGECVDWNGNTVGSWGISSRKLEKELSDKDSDELRALLISAYDNKDAELCSAITAEFEKRCVEAILETER